MLVNGHLKVRDRGLWKIALWLHTTGTMPVDTTTTGPRTGVAWGFGKPVTKLGIPYFVRSSVMRRNRILFLNWLTSSIKEGQVRCLTLLTLWLESESGCAGCSCRF